MLDIKVIRENPERVKAAVKSRNGNLDAEVDELIAIDAERRALQQENDKLKQQQNEASKQIPQIKKAGETPPRSSPRWARSRPRSRRTTRSSLPR